MNAFPNDSAPSAIAPISARQPELPQRVAEAVADHGYAIVADLIDRETCAELTREIDRIEADEGIEHGQNDFEGFHTRRIFDLISRGPRVRDLVLHGEMLDIMQALLGEDFLLSGTTSMHIGPGETNQLLHADDGMISLPRPHPATMITTLWALSDFRAENGATRLVPGSHLFEATPRPGERFDTIAVEMEPGSAIFIHGSLWHGGGPNSTANDERYGLSVQFVAGWCRQQQNLMLGTSREVVATYPTRLQELIGYSMYRNVMGHVEREHPLTLLGLDRRPEMVWDRMDDSESD